MLDDVHERMIHELYQRASVSIDYLGSDEAERVRVLSKELSHDRPLRSPFLDYREETARELGALGATISGAGPTVLVWTHYEQTGGVLAGLRSAAGDDAEVLRAPFEPQGADVRTIA